MNTHSSTHCRFCSIASAGASAAAFDRPWLESAEYIAIASIGALVPGWSLIVPRKHGLNLSEDAKRAEFHEFAREAIQRIEMEYGACVVFEHGCVFEDSLTGCGTGHAHLHVVPLESITTQAVAFDRSLDWTECKISEIAERSNGCEYLFMADRFDAEETLGYLAELRVPRSQFFRRVIASTLGREHESDYRTHRQEKVSNETAERLRERHAVAA